MTALLELQNLTVRAGRAVLVDELSLQLNPGERLTILGETGAGKSVLVQAIMDLLPAGLTQSGLVCVDGQDLAALTPSQRRRLWGRTMTMLPQEPWHALDPLMSSRQQVAEVYECVRLQPSQQARSSAERDLEALGLAGDMDKRPYELSGGMAQRVAFRAATAGDARLLLADEPTKGLDTSRRDAIVRLLREHADAGAVLTITHDIEVAQQLGGSVIVMRGGRVVEQGPAEVVLAAPRAAYTRALIEASPRCWPERSGVRTVDSGEPLLTASGLTRSRGGRALFAGLEISVRPGEIIGITGDSGSGKSTLGDILLGLLAPDHGTVRRQAGIARHRFQKLYQDPPAAFAPQVPLQVLFNDLLALHRLDAGRLPPLLERLRLDPALLQRPVAEVSGGELQRLAMARCMLLDPVLVFADEPVSRLDPITAREVIELFLELAVGRGCAVLLVSHDPVLVERVCGRVLRLGS